MLALIHDEFPKKEMNHKTMNKSMKISIGKKTKEILPLVNLCIELKELSIDSYFYFYILHDKELFGHLDYTRRKNIRIRLNSFERSTMDRYGTS